MDHSAPETIAAVWDEFCEDLKVMGRELARSTTPHDEQTVAEGIRHLGRLVRMGLENSVEGSDPNFPVIIRLVDETKKFGCDNPDTIYQKAALNGKHKYKITGTRGTVDYLSFLTQKGNHQTPGGMTRSGFIDSNDLRIKDDGTFEIILSQEPVEGNWLKIEPETESLGIRQTCLDRRVETPAELHIERLGTEDVPAPLEVEQIRTKLKAAAGFGQYCTNLFTNWTESYLKHPNQLPPADQDACIRAGGDPNIYFYRSFWKLEDDEALVIHIPRIPPCDTWNLQIDNYWQESMDYRYHRSHVNKHTAQYNDNGSVTMVVAHSQVDHENWLSTAQHRLGHFAMRYIRADEHVDPITKLCKLDDIVQTVAALETQS